MLKETEAEKHRYFCHIFIIGVILVRGCPLDPPLSSPIYEHWAPGAIPYGKSGPGYRITFIKRL